MNLYETIKAAVTTRQAAESFGLAMDKHGMAKCPFHDDHHPSLKLDKRYYCFACGESGDVIDFTAKFFGISMYSAAIKLARDSGSIPDLPQNSISPYLMQSRSRKRTRPAFFRCPRICNDTVVGSGSMHRKNRMIIMTTGLWRLAGTLATQNIFWTVHWKRGALRER